MRVAVLESFLIGVSRFASKVVLQIDMFVPLIGRRVFRRIDCAIIVYSDRDARRLV